MAQQLAIIVLVDVARALHNGTLTDNVYLIDNMKPYGSQGEGTGALVTAVNGTYWSDGSQGTEQVLNWLPYSIGSTSPALPRSYHAARSRQSDQHALSALAGVTDPAAADTGTALEQIRASVGTKAAHRRRAHHLAEHKILDLTGNVIPAGADTSGYSFPAPEITDITGEAVDQKIIYPAQYGSPDMVSDGWYWSATVDTSRPGTYAYTMHVRLHRLDAKEGEPVWEQVDLTCDSSLIVTTAPKINAFTGTGIGPLPLP
jgi:hypothetical protein